jgi:hypothetical protein
MSHIESSLYTLDGEVDKMAWFTDSCPLGSAVPWTRQYCNPTAAYDCNVSTYWPRIGTFEYYYAKDAEMSGSGSNGLGSFVSADYRQDNADNCNYTTLECFTSQSPSVSLPWLHNSVNATSNYSQQQVTDMADVGTDYWIDHCNYYANTSETDLSVAVPQVAVSAPADDYLSRQQQLYNEVPADTCQLVASSDCLQLQTDSTAALNSSQCQQGKNCHTSNCTVARILERIMTLSKS